MNKELIQRMQTEFDELSQTVPGENVEFWFARELQKILGYSQWRNFQEVISKGKISCKNAGAKVTDHFADVSKMVDLGSGAERSIKDLMLTRYACYLIAQNGDSRKETIAFAQTYFALQTRKQELLEERIELRERLATREKLKESETELSKNIYERGVDSHGFGRIRSKGDAALFGGKTTQDMKNRMGVSKGRALADFLPTITIAAKNLATEITNLNVRREDMQGEGAITIEHVQNNKSVRSILEERGIKPEELSAESDLKKLERRVKSEEKKLIQGTALPDGANKNESKK